MNLETQELLQYINHMLANGWSLAKINKEKGIRRQTVRDKLKREGYVLNQEINQFVRMETGEKDTQDYKDVFIDSKPQKPKKKAPATKSYDDLQKRVESLEKRLEAIEKQTPSTLKVDVISFSSGTHDRNYPLHQEVVDLLDELRTANKHLKIKDLVNTGLYIGLSKMKDSDNIE